MRRTMIKYENMKECHVTSFLATYRYLDVVITFKRIWFMNRRIHGNFETQKFADIVNTMITASSSTTPNFLADNAVMGTIAEWFVAQICFCYIFIEFFIGKSR